MVKNLPAMWETWVRSLGWKKSLEKEWLPTPVFLPGEFHGQRNLAGYIQVALVVKNPPANTGDIRDVDSIPESGRSPRGGNGNPLQCSCLENPHGQRSLAGYGPWGHTGLDVTERLAH